MSRDYPDRAVWLAKRETDRKAIKNRGRMIRVVPAGGKNKDPGEFHAHRRLEGPYIRPVGPGSYDEWKAALAEERSAKRRPRAAA